MTTSNPNSSSNSGPLLDLLDSPTSKLIKQGAEAKVYFSSLIPISTLTLPTNSTSTTSSSSTSTPTPTPVLIKYRFPKSYRHESLSSSLTAHRTAAEARALLRCFKSNPIINVPHVTCVDELRGILGLEWIDGVTVRECLGGGQEDEGVVEDQDEEQDEDEDQGDDDDDPVLSDQDQVFLTDLIGIQLARMHSADVIHGDLTTSNMMLRDRKDQGSVKGKGRKLDEKDQVVLIDFGLSSTSSLIEDKAVDLYVLERAFGSTHPNSRHLFERILNVYGDEVERLWKIRREDYEKNLQFEKEKEKEKNQAQVADDDDDDSSSSTKVKQKKLKSKGTSINHTTPPRLNPWEETKRKLDEVRLRGRKRSMVG